MNGITQYQKDVRLAVEREENENNVAAEFWTQ